MNRFNAINEYRLARWFYLHHMKAAASILRIFTYCFHNSFIPYTCEIGEGTILGYKGIGVVIHSRSIIGKNCLIGTNVTIGGKEGSYEVPVIGDRVTIATGAKILGNVHIHNDAVIGANAVVIHDVPPKAVVGGYLRRCCVIDKCMVSKGKRMEKDKILLVGSADLSGKVIGGQLEMTRIIYNQLTNKGLSVCFCNMFYLGAGIHMIFYFLSHYFYSDYVIIITSDRGTAVMMTFIYFLKKVKNNITVFLAVGNQVSLLKKISRKKISSVDKIYFEIDEMGLGFKDKAVKTGVFPNSKKVKAYKPEKINEKCPLRICYYSEISYRKGFDIIVKILDEINKTTVKYVLDVYGFFSSVDEKQMKNYFLNRDYVRYKKALKREGSAQFLRKYLFMVFPSRHLNEGLPGVIIDAYEAGLPVISSDVSYLRYVVHNGITGYLFHKQEELKLILINIADNPKLALNLRENCINEAGKFDIEKSVDKLLLDIKRMRVERK